MGICPPSVSEMKRPRIYETLLISYISKFDQKVEALPTQFLQDCTAPENSNDDGKMDKKVIKIKFTLRLLSNRVTVKFQ